MCMSGRSGKPEDVLFNTQNEFQPNAEVLNEAETYITDLIWVLVEVFFFCLFLLLLFFFFSFTRVDVSLR